MREILFRAKSKTTNEWVEGYYFQGFTGICYIIVMHDHILGMTEYYEIFPETLGQFTGLLDKNGKKIFEGDLLKVICLLDSAIMEVCYENSCFVLKTKDSHGYKQLGYMNNIEAIGNIHEKEQPTCK